MGTTEVVVLKKHSYAQRTRVPGQKYEIRDEHVRLFQKMGLVAISPKPVVKRPIESPIQKPAAAPVEIPKRRTYKRRDLEAEQ